MVRHDPDHLRDDGRPSGGTDGGRRGNGARAEGVGALMAMVRIAPTGVLRTYISRHLMAPRRHPVPLAVWSVP